MYVYIYICIHAYFNIRSGIRNLGGSSEETTMFDQLTRKGLRPEMEVSLAELREPREFSKILVGKLL
jgi:hypothetical protein